MRLTTALPFVLFPVLVFGKSEGDSDDSGPMSQEGKDSNDRNEISLTISGSDINGDVIMNGFTRHKLHITHSVINGNLVFVNGCAVRNNVVHECDGSKRRINAIERKKLRKRISHLQKHQKVKVVGKKVKIHQKQASFKKERHNVAAQQNQTALGRNNPRARRHGFGYSGPLRYTRYGWYRRRRGHHYRFPGNFSPCKKCPKPHHGDKDSVKGGGKKTVPKVGSEVYESSGGHEGSGTGSHEENGSGAYGSY